MRRWLGLAAIAAIAIGIVGYKAFTREDTPAALAPQAKEKAPRVLLFADLREADESCGCGEIIRAVRGAAKRGVPVRENDAELGRAHHVTTRPSVIILDAQGRESARYEGESEETIEALQKDLDALAGDEP